MINKTTPAPAVSNMKNQASILQQIALSMTNFGAPTLLDERFWAEAERMAEAGLLQRHEPVFKSFGYSLAAPGIEAYNLAFPPAPPAEPVKAWGSQPPKTLKTRIKFIQAQCTRPLEDAYSLEVEDEKGHTKESLTLSSSALDQKLKDLGYDRNAEDRRIFFHREESYALYTCDLTGALIEGSSAGDPNAIGYELDGFAWRRSNAFQMEERDWQEAKAFVERLDRTDSEQRTLIKLIVNSCFLDPARVNDTGLLCPGGGCQSEFSELIELFEFMRPGVQLDHENSESPSMAPGGGS